MPRQCLHSLLSISSVVAGWSKQRQCAYVMCVFMPLYPNNTLSEWRHNVRVWGFGPPQSIGERMTVRISRGCYYVWLQADEQTGALRKRYGSLSDNNSYTNYKLSWSYVMWPWLARTEAWPQPHPIPFRWSGTWARPYGPTSVFHLTNALIGANPCSQSKVFPE